MHRVVSTPMVTYRQQTFSTYAPLLGSLPSIKMARLCHGLERRARTS